MMKGVSKYGQFIVKRTNSADENSAPNVTASRAMKGTKLLIKNGKLHAPLSVRSTNIIPTNNENDHKVEKTPIHPTALGRPKSDTDLVNKKSIKSKVIEKFDIFCDSANTENESQRDCLSSVTPSADVTVKSRTSTGSSKDSTDCFAGSDSNFSCREKDSQASTSSPKTKMDSSQDLTDESQNDSGLNDVSYCSKDEFDLSSSHSGNTKYSKEYMAAKVQFYERTTSYSKISFTRTNSLYNTYNSEIYAYMMWREETGYGRPRWGYMTKQKEINIEMRAILIDWFVDVCLDYDLSPFTFYKAVSIVDRALSTVDCPREKFQLLGAAALFIATKIEDENPPRLYDIAFLTEDACTVNQIKKMEKILLRVINFELNVPTADIYAHFYLFFQPCPKRVMSLIWYLLELSCLHYECLKFQPSRVAAAAFSLAIYAVKVNAHRAYSSDSAVGYYEDQDDECDYEESITEEKYKAYEEACWSADMVKKTGISREEFLVPLKHLAMLHEKAKTPSGLHAMFLKYGTIGSHCVSRYIVMPLRLPFCD